MNRVIITFKFVLNRVYGANRTELLWLGPILERLEVSTGFSPASFSPLIVPISGFRDWIELLSKRCWRFFELSLNLGYFLKIEVRDVESIVIRVTFPILAISTWDQHQKSTPRCDIMFFNVLNLPSSYPLKRLGIKMYTSPLR